MEKKMKTFKELLEGIPQGMIASFEQPDDPEFNLDVYKMGSKFYIDAGNWDDEAKNSKELKIKLKRYGVNPDKPIFGKIPK